MPLNKTLTRFALPVLVALGTSSSMVLAADQPTTPPNETGGATAYISDTAITTKVKSALISNKLTGISVTTELGVVALSGSVASEELRQRATKIASSIDGVRGVDYAGLSVKMGS